MSRAVKLAAALLLSCTLGLHWAALQSVAWTTMLVERAQTASFTAALKTTFDGQHPCKLCQVVRAGQSAEKKSEATLKLVKLETAAPREVAPVLQPPCPVPLVASATGTWSVRTETPPLPPPRA